ncbi:uncharacterized protein G2W53_017299 [Senna tora]|uniref:Uncharacterized protein n=1 Tax=Senna tora TaxID=362788 RepID=A0A834TTM2_9FABA|nr:uncharacterized protein G2W53_017299 [Senna tora]
MASAIIDGPAQQPPHPLRIYGVRVRHPPYTTRV